MTPYQFNNQIIYMMVNNINDNIEATKINMLKAAVFAFEVAEEIAKSHDSKGTQDAIHEFRMALVESMPRKLG